MFLLIWKWGVLGHYIFLRFLNLRLHWHDLEGLLKHRFGVPSQKTQSRAEYLTQAFRSAAPSGNGVELGVHTLDLNCETWSALVTRPFLPK